MIALEKEMPLSLAYSNNSHALFVLINSVDTRIMQDAGLCAWQLPNVILSEKTQSADDTKENIYMPEKSAKIKKKLSLHFPEHLHTQEEKDYLLFTYPVRCIRRKNVLEAALLSKLYSEYSSRAVNFCITLEGNSTQEAGYSKRVYRLFQEGYINGFFNIGNHLEETDFDFHAVCKASDLMLSSSTQEGFGFSFLGAIDWGTALVARELPVTQEFAPCINDWDLHWYSEFFVPFSVMEAFLPDIRELLVTRYTEKLKRLTILYDNEHISRMAEHITTMCSAECIDFSFLPLEVQELIFVHFEECNQQLQSQNKPLLEKMSVLVESKQGVHREKLAVTRAQVREKIEARYGSEQFLKTFKSLCSIAKDSRAQPPKNVEASAEYIKQSFLSLSHLRALYDQIGVDDEKRY